MSRAVLVAIVSVIAVPWFVVLGRVRSGRPVLIFEPRRHVPWGVLAVVLSFLLLLVGQAAAVELFGPLADDAPSIRQTIDFLTASGVATLTATAVSALATALAWGATPRDIGWSLQHIGRDIVIGVGAFLILGPLSFAIQAFFVYQLEIESHHPLIELVKNDPTHELFAFVAVVAVIVAPIAEEYFFRVLFQGWLEKHFLRSHRPTEGADVGTSVTQPHAADKPPIREDQRTEDGNPYRNFVPFSRPPELVHEEVEVTEPAGGLAPNFIPIFCSAALFAVMHWSHGPDPAALFVLAVGLGYVYQRTHRWLPCIVTHCCLNATTMVMLWAGMRQLAE